MVRNWIGFFAMLSGSVVVLAARAALNEDFTSCEANAELPWEQAAPMAASEARRVPAARRGTSGTSGTSGQGGQAGDGGGCDTSADPNTEVCLVADDYAIFVDGTASTTGDGSKASPFKTIGEGIAAAKSSGKLVLVCDTDYDEQVKIDAGARVYGGFKCSDWTYETGQKAVVKPTAKGYALEVANVTSPVVIQDMEFDAQDGTDPGESSIAAFVHDSTGVAFDRVAFVAGKGVKGKDGVLVPVTFREQPDEPRWAACRPRERGERTDLHMCTLADQSKGGGGGDLAARRRRGLAGAGRRYKAAPLPSARTTGSNGQEGRRCHGSNCRHRRDNGRHSCVERVHRLERRRRRRRRQPGKVEAVAAVQSTSSRGLAVAAAAAAAAERWTWRGRGWLEHWLAGVRVRSAN